MMMKKNLLNLARGPLLATLHLYIEKETPEQGVYITHVHAHVKEKGQA